jgi:thiol-disulfide isomerase/thioredoxin
MSQPLLLLYQRSGCHLCEEMLQQLERIGQETPFRLKLVDVDSERELQIRYGERVPVLEAADGRELSEFFLDEGRVRDYFSGAGNGV